jgi:hypothetical protein
MFADSHTSPTDSTVRCVVAATFFANVIAFIVSDERGDGVLFVERSSELILQALG